jgi:anti-sigma-K factor RskA
MAMSNPDDHKPSPEEEMLPWYAAGTLSPEETHAVEARLQVDPALRAHLARIDEERLETIHEAEMHSPASARMAERLFAAVDADAAERNRSSALTRWTTAIGAWLDSLTPRNLALAAGAAVLVIVLQAAVLGTLLTGGQRSDPRLASGPGQSTPGGVSLLVGFQPDARVDDIAALLHRIGGRIVDGPRAGGLFLVRVDGNDPAGADRQAATARLQQAGGIVKLVIPAP